MNTKTNKKTASAIALAVASVAFAFLFGIRTSHAGTASFSYTPMEEIPGFGTPSSYPEYILAIYKFGLWTVGIAAVLMISVGAFMYITSAGNTSSMGKAKGIIFDAIAGVILALTSYILLYTINPALLDIKSLSDTSVGAAGVLGSSGGPSGTTNGYSKACSGNTSNTPIDYSKATSDSSIKLSSACDKYNFSGYGVDPCILKTIAQMESNCGANKGPSSAGACGLMQLLPSTAGVTCDQLMNDDNLSIKLAANYISQNINSSCVSGSQSAIFAGYNSGYGCGSSACSPKHALCASSDCPGSKAYECCINPGGLSQSINYAWNGMGLYAQCK